MGRSYESVSAVCVLFLVTPMALLNPLGRDAFLGYYAGVIATWAAYVVALRAKPANS
jgi:hypothetical protein